MFFGLISHGYGLVMISLFFGLISHGEGKAERRDGRHEVRAPTVDVGYVPNAKYLAHIPHQTKFDPIYQML